MGIIDTAQERQNRALQRERPIDYERMNRIFPSQKAALTRAVKKVEQAREVYEQNYRLDPGPLKAAIENLATVIKKAIAEWNECGAWPDDWARWQRALDDALPWNQSVDIHYL